jgi:hypothetical protein
VLVLYRGRDQLMLDAHRILHLGLSCGSTGRPLIGVEREQAEQCGGDSSCQSQTYPKSHA